MNKLNIIYLLGGILFAHMLLLEIISAQLVADSMQKTFQNMTSSMDLVYRGTYNITPCVKEMFECWENIRGDRFCYRDRFYWTICDLMRQNCYNVQGMRFFNLDSWTGHAMPELVCKNFKPYISR